MNDKKEQAADKLIRRLYEEPGIGKTTMWKLRSAAEVDKRKFVSELCEMDEKKLSERLEKAGIKSGQKNIIDAITRVKQNRNNPGRFDHILGGKVSFASIDDPEFPEALKMIPDPPFAIYYTGRLPEMSLPRVAVIGSRTPTEYGKEMTKIFAENLAAEGVQIISGLAYGIDSIAERAALNKGGYAAGVLGCGIDICYPQKNRDLYDEMMIRGGVITEYPPTTQPKQCLFPTRNRIISGLSDLVLVIEAKEKSGTMITVDMALEQGREVYAVPGRINDRTSAGCNRLISHGAGVACTPGDILDALGMAEHDNDMLNRYVDLSALQLSSLQTEIVRLLDMARPVEISVLLDQLKPADPSLTYSELRMEMTMLMLKHLVKESSPGYFLLAY